MRCAPGEPSEPLGPALDGDSQGDPSPCGGAARAAARAATRLLRVG